MVMTKKASQRTNSTSVENGEGVMRRKPGRRSGAEHTQAVSDLLSGKSSADQLAKRYGVLPTTVTAWRDGAIGGIEAALRQGDGGSPRERELEHHLVELEETLKDVSLKYALASRGVEEWKSTARPSRRQRSPKCPSIPSSAAPRSCCSARSWACRARRTTRLVGRSTRRRRSRSSQRWHRHPRP